MTNIFLPIVFFLKNRLWLLLSLVISLILISSAFMSCTDFSQQGSANNPATTGSSGSNQDDDGDDGDDGDDNEVEQCEDDEGDLCKGNETCEKICESIYEEFEEKRLCMNRGDETVAKLEKVHDLLMGSKAGSSRAKTRSPSKVENDLNKIGDDDDDDDGVSIDDFKCYVQIGVTKWIEQIEAGLGGSGDNNKRSNLIETLKWLVEEDGQESAEILKDDINEGDDVLEAILLTLVGTADGDVLKKSHHGTTHCIGGSGYDAPPSPIPPSIGDKTDVDIWWFSNFSSSSDHNLKVVYHKNNTTRPDGEFELASRQDKILYNALSCMHTNLGTQNIFSYSAKEQNSHIFDLAFKLLMDNVCSDIDRADDRKAGCARALICWTAWQNACNATEKGDITSCGNVDSERPGNSDNSKLWDYAADHSESLEGGEGDSNHNECTTEAFADFF